MRATELNEISTSRISSYFGLVLAAGCLGGCFFISNHVARVWLAGAGVLAGIVSEVTAGQAMRGERRESDRTDIELTLSNRALLEGNTQNSLPDAVTVPTQPTAQPITAGAPVAALPASDIPAKPEPYRMTDLNKAAHILMYAGTGSGKSVVGDWLVDEVLEGLLIDLNPHLDKRDGGDHFTPQTVEECIEALHEYERGERTSLRVGAGRNMEAIAIMLEALGSLMDERYQIGWMSEHVQFNIRIEESPIIANSDVSKEVWKQVSKPAIREARKVKLRYFIVTQSKRVAALSWQGAGDLLDNLTQVRLGTMALEYATKNADEATTYWLRQDWKQFDYCWLIETSWAPYQDLSYRVKSNGTNALSTFASDIWKNCRPGEAVTARALIANKRHLRQTPPDEIRAAFVELESKMYGSIVGEGDRLSFIRNEE